MDMVENRTVQERANLNALLEAPLDGRQSVAVQKSSGVHDLMRVMKQGRR